MPTLDRLMVGMGFGPLDMASTIAPQLPFEFHADGTLFAAATATAVAFRRFCPDFVCQLTDGRVFVAENKGEHLRAVPKEIERRQVGAVWAERSAGQAVFALVCKQARGMSMAQQIEASLG